MGGPGPGRGRQVTAYGAFAALYDELMADVPYDEWAARYTELLRLFPGARAADMACGTGEIALRLSRAGCRVTGTDLSPEMIARAQEKARQQGQEALFAVQDMRCFALPRRCDAVVCACDGVNYLTSLKDVERCFARVFASLKSGGRFAFDISSQWKLRAMAGQMYGEDREDLTYLWMNEWQEERRCLRMSLCFFLREADGRYRRFDEEHVQRAHSEQELLSALQGAGFARARVYSGFTAKEARPGDERLVFCAEKP